MPHLSGPEIPRISKPPFWCQWANGPMLPIKTVVRPCFILDAAVAHSFCRHLGTPDSIEALLSLAPVHDAYLTSALRQQLPALQVRSACAMGLGPETAQHVRSCTPVFDWSCRSVAVNMTRFLHSRGSLSLSCRSCRWEFFGLLVYFTSNRSMISAESATLPNSNRPLLTKVTDISRDSSVVVRTGWLRLVILWR